MWILKMNKSLKEYTIFEIWTMHSKFQFSVEIQIVEYDGGFSIVFLFFSVVKSSGSTFLFDSCCKTISFWVLFVERKRIWGMVIPDNKEKAIKAKAKLQCKTKVLSRSSFMFPLITKTSRAMTVPKVPINAKRAKTWKKNQD